MQCIQHSGNRSSSDGAVAGSAVVAKLITGLPSLAPLAVARAAAAAMVVAVAAVHVDRGEVRGAGVDGGLREQAVQRVELQADASQGAVIAVLAHVQIHVAACFLGHVSK
jgi:hypothetical protein